jgi:hypothetical protein
VRPGRFHPRPAGLSPTEREQRFALWSAGSGGTTEGGIPAQPSGPLNTQQALFMTHPINGLGDLLYIVMFGARPYVSLQGDERVPATREQIFRSTGVEHLACRHADPAAAMAAAAPLEGRTVAFADPLGMYIHSFSRDLFSLDDDDLPEEWIRFSRGTEGRLQRLELGPGDDDPRFLDDATVSVGTRDVPVTGGFQVVKQVEVGPVVVAGPPRQLSEEEYVVVDEPGGPIDCQAAAMCKRIRRLQDDHAHQARRTGPRTVTWE